MINKQSPALHNRDQGWCRPQKGTAKVKAVEKKLKGDITRDSLGEKGKEKARTYTQ